MELNKEIKGIDIADTREGAIPLEFGKNKN